MKHFILLIDDDKMPMRYYVIALERSGYEVLQLDDPDKVVDYMSATNKRCPSLIILDIMLPPGRRYRGNPDAAEGLSTGVLLYPELKQHFREAPILVLTNVSNRYLLSNLPDDAQVLSKMNVPPFELVRIVNKKLEIAHL